MVLLGSNWGREHAVVTLQDDTAGMVDCGYLICTSGGAGKLAKPRAIFIATNLLIYQQAQCPNIDLQSCRLSCTNF